MNMKRDNRQYRKLLVDDQEGWYTMIIQYHRHFIISHWITIKTMESQDLEKLNKTADEIIAGLETKIEY